MPTASGLAYHLGWLTEALGADGLEVGILQDGPAELRRHHFDHQLARPRSARAATCRRWRPGPRARRPGSSASRGSTSGRRSWSAPDSGITEPEQLARARGGAAGVGADPRRRASRGPCRCTGTKPGAGARRAHARRRHASSRSRRSREPDARGASRRSAAVDLRARPPRRRRGRRRVREGRGGGRGGRGHRGRSSPSTSTPCPTAATGSTTARRDRSPCTSSSSTSSPTSSSTSWPQTLRAADWAADNLDDVRAILAGRDPVRGRRRGRGLRRRLPPLAAPDLSDERVGAARPAEGLPVPARLPRRRRRPAGLGRARAPRPRAHERAGRARRDRSTSLDPAGDRRAPPPALGRRGASPTAARSLHRPRPHVQVARAAEATGFAGLLVPVRPGRRRLLGPGHGPRPRGAPAPLRRRVPARRSPPRSTPRSWRSASSASSTIGWRGSSRSTADGGPAAVGDFAAGPDRLARADELLDVHAGVWRRRPFTFEGEYFQVEAGGSSAVRSGGRRTTSWPGGPRRRSSSTARATPRSSCPPGSPTCTCSTCRARRRWPQAVARSPAPRRRARPRRPLRAAARRARPRARRRGVAATSTGRGPRAGAVGPAVRRIRPRRPRPLWRRLRPARPAPRPPASSARSTRWRPRCATSPTLGCRTFVLEGIAPLEDVYRLGEFVLPRWVPLREPPAASPPVPVGTVPGGAS